MHHTALGGLSGGNNPAAGLTAQLAQQQQQLMAMVQTQSLLAAMQAQANANAQAQVQSQAKRIMPNSLGGLLPTPLIPRTASRDMQRHNRKRRNDGWGGGNYGNKRDRPDRNRWQPGFNRGQNQQNRGRPYGGGVQNQQTKKAPATNKEETKNEEAVEEEIEEEVEGEGKHGNSFVL